MGEDDKVIADMMNVTQSEMTTVDMGMNNGCMTKKYVSNKINNNDYYEYEAKKIKRINKLKEQYIKEYEEKFSGSYFVDDLHKKGEDLMFFLERVPEEFENIDTFDIQCKCVLLLRCIDDIIHDLLKERGYKGFLVVRKYIALKGFDIFKIKREGKNVRWITYEYKHFKNQFEVTFKK